MLLNEFWLKNNPHNILEWGDRGVFQQYHCNKNNGFTMAHIAWTSSHSICSIVKEP